MLYVDQLFCQADEYPQHMFFWRNKQNYPLIIMKYSPYLFHCSIRSCPQPVQSYSKNLDPPSPHPTPPPQKKKMAVIILKFYQLGFNIQ